MEIRLLREMFREGVLRKAYIMPAPLENDRYILVLDRLTGSQEQVTRKRDGKVKVYKRMTGATQDAKSIGFKEVTIRFN